MTWLKDPRSQGRVLVCAMAALLFLDGLLQLMPPPELVAAFDRDGLSDQARQLLPFVTLTCAITLGIRATSIAGGVLTTGFLGGAISLHVAHGEAVSPAVGICLLLGALVWTGLLLTEPSLRPFLPWRRTGAREPQVGKPLTA